MPDSNPQRVQFIADALHSPALNSQREMWSGRLPAFQGRLAEINLEADFRERADLLDPQTGKLSRGLDPV